jgi:DoxX-like family
MNITLWVGQVLLTMAFFTHGWLFLSPSPEIAVVQLFLGVAEVAAAVGLVLPGLTRIMPWLVTWAAVGIMIVMVSATLFHLIRGEMSSAAITLQLLAMATFVAYMRDRCCELASGALRRATKRGPRADGKRETRGLMRQPIVSEFVSLDAVLQAPGGTRIAMAGSSTADGPCRPGTTISAQLGRPDAGRRCPPADVWIRRKERSWDSPRAL